MMPRFLLRTLLPVCLSAVFVGFTSTPAGPIVQVEGPNILWISVEDISPHLGAYGDPLADTPNIDAFAREAVRYTHAFTTAGVCAPSRSTIITGVYATSFGGHHMRTTAWLPDSIHAFPELLRRAGYYATNHSKTDYNFQHDPDTWDVSSNQAHWRNRPSAEQPFFAVFNFNTSHESRIEEGNYGAAVEGLPPGLFHDPETLTPPPYYPDTPTVRRDWARYYDIISAVDRQVGAVLAELEADGLADDTIVFFWSDHGAGLPRAKRWLYDSGTHVPLLVRIPPKYRRDGQGTPGSVNHELVSFIDLAPTVMNLGGLTIPAYMQGRAFLGDDLTPPRRYVYGARDRMDERYDIIRMVRDDRYKYIRNYEPYKAYYQYMNTPERGETMKELRRLDAEGALPPFAAQFMAATKPVEELYDTLADPHELFNLAGDTAHTAILERLRAAHEDWVRETYDIGLIPEPIINALQREHDTPIYTLARRPGTLPIERIRHTAAQATVDGPSTGPSQATPDLTQALGDPHPAVRYWAVTGLRLQGPDARASVDALQPLLADSSAAVRIAAAWTLCTLTSCDASLDTLERELQNPDEWARLSAAIALDELGEAARPATEAMQTAMNDGNKYVVRVVNHALNALQGTNNVVP